MNEKIVLTKNLVIVGRN